MTYSNGLALGNLPPANDPSITDSATSATAALSRTLATTSVAGARNPAVDAVATDSAKLSMAGTMLAQASTGSDVRFDKVAALRQSIEAGTYNPTSADVASKLVDTLLK